MNDSRKARLKADWLAHPETRAVFDLLERAGHQACAVGGCVRDTLLEREVNDIDIATDARPERVLALARDAGIRAIPTGIEHGTVTLLPGRRPHEVTTFRRDVATDGRRAVVAYADSLQDDAARRDFTMNALYADRHGNILDPVGGLEDLRARKVRFIGDPAARIAEDYLRILRFFRFHAWFGDPLQGLDETALAAIADNLDGLARLSRERIGTEMKKLLSAPDPAPALAAMQATGALLRLLPGADAAPIAPLVHFEGARPPEPIRRLAALGGDDAAQRLRLSRAEARRLDLLREMMHAPMPLPEIAYRHGAPAAIDTALLRAALGGPPPPPDLDEIAASAAAQHFPLRGADLEAIARGPALGRLLGELEQRWIDSGFALTREELLRHARRRADP